LSNIFLSPKTRKLLERAREIADTVLAPRAEAVDRTREWPQHAFDALSDAGLLGLNVPEALGGHGEGLLALASITEVLGRSCGTSAISYGMHCVGSAVIAAKPTDFHRERYLRPIAEGKHVTTLSLSEPGTGVHFYLPTTRLERTDSKFSVRGKKHFVTNGRHADSYVVSTLASDASLGEFSCILVDSDTEGLRWSGEWSGMGMRGNSAVTMNLEDAQVPAANLLGNEGEQIWYMFEIITPYFLVAMAGTYLGIGQAALDAAIEHVRSRTHVHSAEHLANADVVQHRIGSLWARLESARQLLYSAAYRGDSGDPGALVSVLSCKAEISEVAVSVVNDAMTLMGGLAYASDGMMSRLLRDVRASHVMAPTTDLLRLWSGRALLGQPLLS
jgi:isovaleryl-CoA dehydrogenase